MTVVLMQHGCIVMQTSCSIYQEGGLLCCVDLQLGPLLQGTLSAALREACGHTPTLLHPINAQQTAHAENILVRDFALYGRVLVATGFGQT